MTVDELIDTILNAPSVNLTYDDVCAAYNDPGDQDTFPALARDLSDAIETPVQYQRARIFITKLAEDVLDFNCRETDNELAAEAVFGDFDPKDIPPINVEATSFY